MKGINKAILIGHLGKDPETRYSASGTAMTTFTLATSESWRDKQSGEQQERTEWHRITMFGRTAEVAGEFLRKGSLVYIEGQIRTRKWEKDGQDRYTTEIVAREMQMLGKKGSSAQKPSEEGGFRRPAPNPDLDNAPKHHDPADVNSDGWTDDSEIPF